MIINYAWIEQNNKTIMKMITIRRELNEIVCFYVRNILRRKVNLETKFGKM